MPEVMRSLTKECDSQSPLVAEPWLTTLVEAIKKEDHVVAEREYQTVRRAELIAQNGPVFWRKFTDVLEVLFRQMEDLFGDHVTKGKISFTRSPYGGGITINKSAYPFVSFSATPNFSESTAHFTYTVVNPEIPQNIGVPGRFLPCRFGVEGDQVVMSLDGTMFTTPEVAAKFIMEKLFTIASSAPAVVFEAPAPVVATAVTTVEQAPAPEFAWPPLRSKPKAFSYLTETPVLEAVPAAVSDAPTPEVSPEVDQETPVAAAAVAVAVEEPAQQVPEPEVIPAYAAPLSLLPPPLPGSVSRSRAVIAPSRAPLSKFFASASRLLGGAPSPKSLPVAPPPLSLVLVKADAPALPEPSVVVASEPVVAVETQDSFVPEAVPEAAATSEPTELEVAAAVAELSNTEPSATEPASISEPSETAEVAEPVEAEVSEQGLAGEDVVLESSEPLQLMEAPAASRLPRRRTRPQMVRTRFRYQDPRRFMSAQKVAAVPARQEPRPAAFRQAAGC